jgi:hypothetical protein
VIEVPRVTAVSRGACRSRPGRSAAWAREREGPLLLTELELAAKLLKKYSDISKRGGGVVARRKRCLPAGRVGRKTDRKRVSISRSGRGFLYRFVWVEQKYECGGPNSLASFYGQLLSTSAVHAPSSRPCTGAIRLSTRPKLTEELRPPAPRRESARKRTPYKDEGCAPFQDPFPTLWISQFASFAHFFCWIVLPRAPSTSMQVPGTFCQRLRFSIFAQPKRTCR